VVPYYCVILEEIYAIGLQVYHIVYDLQNFVKRRFFEIFYRIVIQEIFILLPTPIFFLALPFHTKTHQ
jgi:hypothetical protein